MGTCDNFKKFLNGESSSDLSLWEKGKASFGGALGQAAFNSITDGIPKIAVNNNVNSGVRALVDSVNSGARSFAGTTTNQATQAVATSAGIDLRLAPPDPQGQTIFNNADFAARSLGNDLISGVIEEANLPGSINAMSALAVLQQNEATTKPVDITDLDCGISAYARDLIKYAPKHNFMFFVEFQFQPDYLNLGIKKHPNGAEDIKFHMLSRQFTRPNISVEYEDVNMYNFHTKVAKRVMYDPFNIRLYDDIQNESMAFLEKYLKARSPIARHDTPLGIYETKGMDFEANPDGNVTGADGLQGGAASMGGYVNDNRSILKQITVYHIFGGGAKVNRFTFINPKIMQFDISDFDMENGTDPSTIDIQVAYDSMFIETDIDVSLSELKTKSKLGKRFLNKFKNRPAGII